MTARLSDTTLEKLPPAIRRSSYERSALKPGVVHLGLGAFHRAHQAPVFEALAEQGDLRWGVIGASLRSPRVSDMLLPQDCLYSLAVEEDGHRTISIIGAILDIIVARQAPLALIEAIASQETHLVTVTVTEKGYKLSPSTGLPIEDDPDLRADLASLDSPLTMAGYLCAGLRLRKQRGSPSVTVMSCDNLPNNGRKLRSAVIEVARAHDRSLADWIEDSCAFPSTMVDRIVPATREEDIGRIAAELGLVDLAPVRTEPFSQWVVEDGFAGERAELERAGVQFTRDIAPWEQAKLRLLNGAHSAMAYLGGLAGLESVDQFVSDSWGRGFVSLLWDEIEPSLDPPEELDLGDYRAMLMRRFANSALGHRLVQIAMDGSQKIPQRLVPAAIAMRHRKQRPYAIALAIAAWIRWQSGRDERGRNFLVDDPLASTTARLLEPALGPLEQVRSVLSLESLFPECLAADGEFESSVAEQLDHLARFGARATIRRFVEQHQLAPEGQVKG